MKKDNILNGDKFYLTHKIEFIPDKYAEEILIKNCEYRHFLYNKAVEKVKQDSPDGRFLKFNEYKLSGFLRATYECKNSKNRPDFLESRSYYFSGILASVSSDVCETCKRIITNRRNGQTSDLHFIKYNSNRQSFTIKNTHSNPIEWSRIVFDNSNGYLLGIKINRTYKLPLGITLREDLNKFIYKGLSLTEIKEITFKYYNDRWYIYLVEDCTNRLNRFKIHVKNKKSKVAGIDVGECNPVVIFDGHRIVDIPEELRFPSDKINAINRRINRLRTALTRKYRSDLQFKDQSNNYKKVLLKFHKANDTLVNIKHDWHNKLAYWILSNYKNIVVDNFKDHMITSDTCINSTIRKNMNYSMSNKSMTNFMNTLKYMAIKYGVNYYESLNNTTNTCSICGNTNSIKLDINDRTFVCELCGMTIDRDINASINCYKQFIFLKNIED